MLEILWRGTQGLFCLVMEGTSRRLGTLKRLYVRILRHWKLEMLAALLSLKGTEGESKGLQFTRGGRPRGKEKKGTCWGNGKDLLERGHMQFNPRKTKPVEGERGAGDPVRKEHRKGNTAIGLYTVKVGSSAQRGVNRSGWEPRRGKALYYLVGRKHSSHERSLPSVRLKTGNGLNETQQYPGLKRPSTFAEKKNSTFLLEKHFQRKSRAKRTVRREDGIGNSPIGKKPSPGTGSRLRGKDTSRQVGGLWLKYHRRINFPVVYVKAIGQEVRTGRGAFRNKKECVSDNPPEATGRGRRMQRETYDWVEGEGWRSVRRGSKTGRS